MAQVNDHFSDTQILTLNLITWSVKHPPTLGLTGLITLLLLHYMSLNNTILFRSIRWHTAICTMHLRHLSCLCILHGWFSYIKSWIPVQKCSYDVENYFFHVCLIWLIWPQNKRWNCQPANQHLCSFLVQGRCLVAMIILFSHSVMEPNE